MEYAKLAESFLKSRDASHLQSSLNLAWIEGGFLQDGTIIAKENMVPDSCRFKFSLRIGNDLSSEEFLGYSERIFADMGIRIEYIKRKIWMNPMIQDAIHGKYDDICPMNP